MGKHGPNPRFASYKATHDTVMQDFREDGFIVSDDISFLRVSDDLIVVEGAIHCLGQIRLFVRKHLRLTKAKDVNSPVQTVEYNYHAVLSGRGNILRYESPDDAHRPHHHVHRYDLFATPRTETVEELYDEEERPTLGQVIKELRAWYYAHLESLPNDV